MKADIMNGETVLDHDGALVPDQPASKNNHEPWVKYIKEQKEIHWEVGIS